MNFASGAAFKSIREQLAVIFCLEAEVELLVIQRSRSIAEVAVWRSACCSQGRKHSTTLQQHCLRKSIEREEGRTDGASAHGA